MKRSALFVTAAVAGLVCGSLFRWTGSSTMASAAAAGRPAVQFAGESGNNSPLSPRERLAVQEWESRLAGYLNGPVTAAVSGAAISPQAQTDNLLTLLREPVSASAMKKAVAFFNANNLSQYEEFMTAVFERWVREDPEAALAATQGLRVPTAKAALVWKVFEISAGDPDIMAKAMTQPSGMIRSVALAALAESVPPGRESEAIKKFIKDRRPGNWKSGGSFPHALFEKLHRGDPRQSLPTDPGAPLRLALETQDPLWRAFLLKTALTHENSPPLSNLTELALDPRNLNGLMEAIGGQVRWDLAEGKNLLAALPEDQRRVVLVQQTGLAMRELQNEKSIEQSTNEAGRHFLRELEQSQGVDGFRAILSESALCRGIRGLEETAQWLTSRQDVAGLEDLARRSALAEPFTTARWLAAMPLSAERDRAVAIFAETHATVDPDRARVWAQSISNPDKMAQTMEKINNAAH